MQQYEKMVISGMDKLSVKSGLMDSVNPKSVALIVAHPDDETLWAGGTILTHPTWSWFIVCLCRKSDAERAAKFNKVLQLFNAEGIMGDLDDGPDQKALDQSVIERAILDLLPRNRYDLIITHSLSGEYTRHIRHEEVSKAASQLWMTGKIVAGEFLTFAYEDGNKGYFPKAIRNASVYNDLQKEIWEKKYNIITEIYGFKKSSWEAQTTPRCEAFWKLDNGTDVQ